MEGNPRFSIVRATGENIHLAPGLNQPFTRFGRLVPVFDGQAWSHTETLWSTPQEYTFPPETADNGLYIGNPHKQILFLLEYGEDGVAMPAGMIRFSRYWNGNCWIEELAVDRAFRHRGYGKRLMAAAEEWAVDNGLRGMVLECQDVNLAACRFYLRLGYTLGGVDRYLYQHTPSRGELALFFYKLFDRET